MVWRRAGCGLSGTERMALTLVKEDGSGKSNANAYANAADGDAYFDGHVAATAWTGATTAQKEAALVMATRLIDAYMGFGGRRVSDMQALQWPRAGCLDADAPRFADVLRTWGGTQGCFDGSSVPACVVAACCEQARELLVVDRTLAPAGEGLKSSNVGGVSMVFDRPGRAPVLSHVTIALLRRTGFYLGDSPGSVRLVRA